MSDWDASSGDEAPPKAAAAAARAGNGSSATASSNTIPSNVSVARRKFDDEDAEEEVKDDWESSDEEEKAKAAKQASTASSSVVAPTRKKKSVKQKIAEKEAEERRRALQGPTSQEPEDGIDPMEYDPIARKRALQQAEIDADVESAASLLGFTSVGKEEIGTTSFSSAKPSSKEEWERLALEIFTTVLKPQSSRDPTGYAKHFVPALTRQLVSPTRDVDIRKLSASVKVWAEEKTKADKEARKSGGRVNLAVASSSATGMGTAGGASKPKTVGTASAKNTMDLEAYGDEALDDGDDLDFM